MQKSRISFLRFGFFIWRNPTKVFHLNILKAQYFGDISQLVITLTNHGLWAQSRHSTATQLCNK